MEKVAIIFGGHGFIGSHLIRKLIETKKYKQIISADIAQEPRFKIQGVEYVYCDVRKKIPENIASDVTEIYNFAAVHTTPGHEDWEYFWTNVLGAQQICDYAQRMDVNNICFTSSISVYGSTEEPLSEDAPLHPTGAYGRSKYCAEKIHHLWQAENPEDRKLIISRPAVIFGYMEQGNFTRLAKLLKRRLFFYAGRKDTVKACGYVKDLISSFDYFLSQSDNNVTYNFAYTERFSIEDVCNAFCKVTSYGAPLGVVPIWLINLGGLSFEVLGKLGIKTPINRTRIKKLFFSTNIVPQNLENSGFVRSFSLEQALEDWKLDSKNDDFE